MQDFLKRDINGKVFSGTHVLLDIRTQHTDLLNDLAFMEQAFHEAIEVGGATLLHIHLHHFQPNGVTGVAVLSESHISVHTWPDIGYAAFDIFMCGDSNPKSAALHLINKFDASSHTLQVLERGKLVLDDLR